MKRARGEKELPDHGEGGGEVVDVVEVRARLRRSFLLYAGHVAGGGVGHAAVNATQHNTTHLHHNHGGRPQYYLRSQLPRFYYLV